MLECLTHRATDENMRDQTTLMNTTKLNKLFVDNVALPAIGIAICILLWCFLSWATWDASTSSSDFPSPITTWNDSAKYFTSPFSHNDAEGFDGIGLEIWRSLKLVGMGNALGVLDEARELIVALRTRRLWNSQDRSNHHFPLWPFLLASGILSDGEYSL